MLGKFLTHDGFAIINIRCIIMSFALKCCKFVIIIHIRMKTKFSVYASICDEKLFTIMVYAVVAGVSIIVCIM